ncbi:uncharacterized protein [Procambarus clarkii]|uniref:uncharacterized protein n=1 Tax=Procambarus clarkii TaxID=6728 RepID=UPI0037431D11
MMVASWLRRGCVMNASWLRHGCVMVSGANILRTTACQSRQLLQLLLIPRSLYCLESSSNLKDPLKRCVEPGGTRPEVPCCITILHPPPSSHTELVKWNTPTS